MNESNTGIAGDDRLPVILFLMLVLLLFGFTSGNQHSYFTTNKQSVSCEQLIFKRSDKLVVENCLDTKKEQEHQPVPAEYTPFLFELIPINSADRDMLMTVKGIGPALGDKIIAYRQRVGAFKSITDLQNLQGVGPKSAAKFTTVFTFYEIP